MYAYSLELQFYKKGDSPMKKSPVIISNTLQIPSHELKISTSRSGGNGGQHVNKTETKVTLHWSIPDSTCLNQRQKTLLLSRLQNRLRKDGTLVLQSSQTRSQLQNHQLLREQLQSLVINNLKR